MELLREVLRRSEFWLTYIRSQHFDIVQQSCSSHDICRAILPHLHGSTRIIDQSNTSQANAIGYELAGRLHKSVTATTPLFGFKVLGECVLHPSEVNGVRPSIKERNLSAWSN